MMVFTVGLASPLHHYRALIVANRSLVRDTGENGWKMVCQTVVLSHWWPGS